MSRFTWLVGARYCRLTSLFALETYEARFRLRTAVTSRTHHARAGAGKPTPIETCLLFAKNQPEHNKRYTISQTHFSAFFTTDVS